MRIKHFSSELICIFFNNERKGNVRFGTLTVYHFRKNSKKPEKTTVNPAVAGLQFVCLKGFIMVGVCQRKLAKQATT